MASTIREIMDTYIFSKITQIKSYFGGGLYVNAVGSSIGTSSAQAGLSILPKVVYDPITGFQKFVAVVPAALLTDQLVQAEENTDKIAGDIGSGVYRLDVSTPAEGTTGRLVDSYTFKSGSIAATTAITVTYYAVTSAGEIDPSNAFFTHTIPAGQWPAVNFGEYTIDTGGELGFDQGERFIARIEGLSQFSMRFNNAQTLPWQKEDHHLTTEFGVAFANVPYANYEIPVEFEFPTVVDEPSGMTQGVEYDINAFTVDVGDQYNFSLDENTGIYTYIGITGNYDGVFFMSITGTAIDQEIVFRTYLDTGSGFAQVSRDYPYKITSADPKSATIPSRAELNAGDRIKVTVECTNKNGERIIFNEAEKKVRAYSRGAPT